MFLLYRYKKNGLPSGLIKLHEFLLEDIIQYFEKEKTIRKRVKEARKTVKKALRFSKKKKIYPSSKTDRAVELMAELREEVDYTHQVLTKSAAEMEALINQIMKERVEDVSSLIDNARIHFRKSELDEGMRLLKEAQKKLAKKFLLETRKMFTTGIDSEIKKIKRQIESKQGKQR
jgi:hypothetical protein